MMVHRVDELYISLGGLVAGAGGLAVCVCRFVNEVSVACEDR
jgi:hypothetical protein